MEYLRHVVNVVSYEQELKYWAAEAIVKLENIQLHTVAQLKQEDSEENFAQESEKQEKVVLSSEAVQEGSQQRQDEEFKAEE
jgi:hypothetical protein